jgi:hypothetical protein
MNEITSPIPVDSLTGLKHMSVFLDPHIGNGVRIIDNNAYENLCHLYGDDGYKEVDGFKFRFTWPRNSLYTPTMDYVYDEPYCTENEILWNRYLKKRRFTSSPPVTTRICRLEENPEGSLTHLMNGRVIFKDPINNYFGQQTGYFLDYVTSPLIVAFSEDGDPLVLRTFNEKFANLLDYLFPNHFVIIIRGSHLDPDKKNEINSFVHNVSTF